MWDSLQNTQQSSSTVSRSQKQEECEKESKPRRDYTHMMTTFHVHWVGGGTEEARTGGIRIKPE